MYDYKKIARKIAKEFISTVNIANQEGKYKNFTGQIDWQGTKGFVKNATFELNEDIEWENGTWENGTWKDGSWINGTWENGTWKNGSWWNGTWENGTWEFGIWKKGTWKSGNWIIGLDKKYNQHDDSPDKWHFYEFDDALKIAIKNGIALLEKNNACWENQKKARDLLAKKRLSYQGTLYEHHYIYSGFNYQTGELLPNTYFTSIFTFYDPADGQAKSSQKTVLIITDINGKVIKFILNCTSNKVNNLHNQMILMIRQSNYGKICGMYMYDYSSSKKVWGGIY